MWDTAWYLMLQISELFLVCSRLTHHKTSGFNQHSMPRANSLRAMKWQTQWVTSAWGWKNRVREIRRIENEDEKERLRSEKREMNSTHLFEEADWEAQRVREDFGIWLSRSLPLYFSSVLVPSFPFHLFLHPVFFFPDYFALSFLFYTVHFQK